MDVDVVSRRIVVASARLLQSKKCRSDYCKEEIKGICLCFVFLVHDCDETNATWSSPCTQTSITAT